MEKKQAFQAEDRVFTVLWSHKSLQIVLTTWTPQFLVTVRQPLPVSLYDIFLPEYSQVSLCSFLWERHTGLIRTKNIQEDKQSLLHIKENSFCSRCKSSQNPQLISIIQKYLTMMFPIPTDTYEPKHWISEYCKRRGENCKEKLWYLVS